MNAQTAYEQVTARVLEALENGIVPWRKPWSAASGMPMSIHGREYRGINALVLAFSEYSSPVWVTFNQARERGGCVRKGEKGTKVILWKNTVRKGETAESEERRGFFATTYTVFNVEQCDGLELPARKEERHVDPIAAAEAIVAGYEGRPEIRHGGDRAFYNLTSDKIKVPARGAFHPVEEYYSTLFHELTHSTGHLNRLNRDMRGMGTDEYSQEELVAELGAAMLCGRAGIANPSTLENSAAYIRHWLGKLKDDRKCLVQAASAAQKAVDLVTGTVFGAKSESEAEAA